MYQPLKACVENKGWLEAASWTKTLVPGGRKGSSIEVKVSVDGCVGGKDWVYTGRAEKVEGKHCLGYETVPFFGGGGWGCKRQV